MPMHTFTECPLRGFDFLLFMVPGAGRHGALQVYSRHSEDEPIPVSSRGEMVRDFTYVDDIVEGVVRVIDRPATVSGVNEPDRSASAPWRIFNIGNSHRVPLMDYIKALERALGKQATLDLLPMQDGDVPATGDDSTGVGFRLPSKSEVEEVQHFVDWYRSYYRQASLIGA